MKARMVSAVMLVLAAGCGAAENPALRAEVSEAQALAQLTQRRADYVDAVTGNDGNAVASFWTTDASIREPGLSVDGERAIAKRATDFFAKGKVSALEFRPEKVFVHGDAAYEFGVFDESGTDGTTPFSVQNNYVLKWQRDQRGDWRLAMLVTGPRNAPAQ